MLSVSCWPPKPALCWCCSYIGHPSSEIVVLGCTGLEQARAVRAPPYTIHPFIGIHCLLQAAVLAFVPEHLASLSEVGFLFYFGGSLLFAQKTAIQWNQIPEFLYVEPQQKMAISPALAHTSFFETGLVIAWNGVLRKQSTDCVPICLEPGILAILSCTH